MPTREETTALAERLAQHERFSPVWITYPEWAGHTPDIAPILEKARKYKDRARAILTKTLPPPAWLAEEDPAFRDTTLNDRSSKTPNNLPASKRRRIRRRKFARIRLQRHPRLPITAWSILFGFRNVEPKARPPPADCGNTRSSLPKPRRCPAEIHLFDNRIAVKPQNARGNAGTSCQFQLRWWNLSLTYMYVIATIAMQYSARRRGMATKMFTVRVDDELEKWFRILARQTGRTVTFYAREALERHIGDLEDRYVASRVLERVRSGEEPLIDFEDWEREYDAKMVDTTDENRKRTTGRSGSRRRRTNPKVRA